MHGSEPALPETFYCVLQLSVTFLVMVDGGIESFIESKSRETLYLGTYALCPCKCSNFCVVSFFLFTIGEGPYSFCPFVGFRILSNPANLTNLSKTTKTD